MLKEVQGCPAKSAISAIFAISPKIAKTLEKSQFLLNLIKSSVTGSAISAIFAISPKIAKKLEKSQFLLNLIKSSVTGGRRVSSKNCDFSNFWDFSKKLRKIRNNCNDPW